MSPNNLTQPLGQSSPKTPLEVPTNPNSTIVDDINFESQLPNIIFHLVLTMAFHLLNMSLTLNQKLDILLVTMYLPKNCPCHMLLMCYSYHLSLFLVKCRKL